MPMVLNIIDRITGVKWGIYSVPAYAHHMKTYGRDFHYEEFIPMWKGENWNPGQWADIF